MAKYQPVTEDLNNEVDEVVGLLKGNIEKIMERDTKLNDLESQAGHLGKISLVVFLG